jgi:tRNA-dihydrouridine synthase A
MTQPFSLSVAPMMERTDRHFRYLMRLVSPRARLYTEMITSAALLHGDSRRFLAFDASEHPVAIQLGGCDPAALAACARLAADAGYDEVNLNVGCPSGRVQAGDFGAKLMLDPGRVADCVAAMREASGLPVTVKTRLGVDEHDDYEVLRGLTARVVDAGVAELIVHARKAWLKGLSPKQNREIPPLDYARVHRLKRDFAELPISINGGFTTEQQVLAQRGKVDGVMLGRGAWQDPLLIGRLDHLLYGSDAPAPIEDILARYSGYIDRERENGTPLKSMSRHLVGLIAHRPGARRWRQRLAELASDGPGIDDLLAELAGMPGGSRYNAGIAAPSAVRQSIQVSECG